MATNEPMRRKIEAPVGDSQFAKTNTGQEIVLVHQQSSSRHVDVDDDFNPMDEEQAIVARRQPVAVDVCDDPDGDVGYGPLRTVRPESMDKGQERGPGFLYEEGAKKTRTKETITGPTYKRKRGRPAGSKSFTSKIEQKPALFDGSSGSSCYNKSDQDDDFEPPTPARKRGRPARLKPAKRKVGQKSLLVDSSSGSSSERKKDKDDDFEPEVSDDDDGRKKIARVKGTALVRAKELEEKLPAEGPSFVKLMRQSHVVRGFWLGLPVSFCKDYLPGHDVEIELEDEEGHIKKTTYLAYKTGLSGGWHGFVKLHHLKVGDVMVFQLVSETKFKVYIVRENKLTATDGALGLLSLDTSMENNTSKKEEESSDEDAKSKEATDGDIRLPGPDIIDDFAAVKCFVNFKIVVGDGRLVLPDHLRRAYYDLCQARKALIHRHLLKQISPELATAVIVETANIAVGIRASSSASLEKLVGWKKTLESFEPMGMDVALMSKRVDDLLALLGALSSTSVAPEGYEEVKLERARAAKQLSDLEMKVSILKDTLKEMDAVMEEMVEASAKKKDQAVQKLAAAPW